jgi:hypothetical protein
MPEQIQGEAPEYFKISTDELHAVQTAVDRINKKLLDAEPGEIPDLTREIHVIAKTVKDVFHISRLVVDEP